jgi:hypothetical protein
MSVYGLSVRAALTCLPAEKSGCYATLTSAQQELSCRMDSLPSIKPTSVARFVRALGGSIVPVSEGSWPLFTWQPTAIEVVFPNRPTHLTRKSLCFDSPDELARRVPHWASSQAYFDAYLQRIADHYVNSSKEDREHIKTWMGLRFEAQWGHPWQETFVSLQPTPAASTLGPGWVRRYLKSRVAELLDPPVDAWTGALPRYIARAQAQMLDESIQMEPRKSSRARL